MDDAPRAGAFHQVLLDTGSVRAGAFRCHPDHPRFTDTGPARDFCFVFPRTAVEIRHEHERPFVANPNVVTFYNKGQEYRRAMVSTEGDRCDWFAVDAAIARDVAAAFDPSVLDSPERPFRLTRGRADARTYLAQRELFDSIAAGAVVDELAFDERVVGLLERVLQTSYAAARMPRPMPNRDAIVHVERLLSASWDRPLRLRDFAAEAGLSVYHLCRTFRQATGQTLHGYRTALRLRSSLEAVRRGLPLIDIAVAAGFSSHSHFTASFRRAFGETPGAVRARKILVAGGRRGRL